jgi:chemotaxis protein methyltransferase CheR
MSEPLTGELLVRFDAFLARQLGLCFGPERWDDLRRGLDSASRDLDFADPAACVQWMLTAPLTRRQIDVLVGHLTVGETYFLRDPRTFEILQSQVLPELIRQRRTGTPRLRIWSAGCASGEEAYSLAIALTRTLPDWKQWQITVLATDINAGLLQKAEEGEYREWSFRGAPAWLKEQYFEPAGEKRYRIVPTIKRLVTFSYLNLADDVYPSLLNDTNAMDLILCRNVVMYFAPQQAKMVFEKLHRSLVDGGWFVCSPAESMYLAGLDMAPAELPGAVFYRRQRREAGVSPGWTGPGRHVPRGKPADPPPRRASVSPQPQRSAKSEARDARVPAEYESASQKYREGRYVEAAADLESLIQRVPGDVEALDLLARAYADQGNLTAALAWCDRAIGVEKLRAGSHYLRATILQEIGWIEEAVQSLKRALYLDPQFVLAHVGLGSLARHQGNAPAAAKHFANALDLLSAYPSDAMVAESDGVTAGRLREIVSVMNNQNP